MTPQQKYMLQVVSKMTQFTPAHLVKKISKWPNDYRKRLSEMKRKGWVEVLGNSGRFAVWSITKEGKKVIQ